MVRTTAITTATTTAMGMVLVGIEEEEIEEETTGIEEEICMITTGITTVTSPRCTNRPLLIRLMLGLAALLLVATVSL